MIPHIGEVAQLAGGAEAVHLFLSQFVARVIAFHIAHHEPRAGLRGRGKQRVGLGQRDRHRLFHKHMLARQQRIAGDVALDTKGGGDGHRVDLRVGQHRRVVGVELGDGPARLHLAAQLLAHLGQRDQLAAGERGEVGQVDLLGHEAAADIAETNGGHAGPSSQGDRWLANRKSAARIGAMR